MSPSELPTRVTFMTISAPAHQITALKMQNSGGQHQTFNSISFAGHDGHSKVSMFMCLQVLLLLISYRCICLDIHLLDLLMLVQAWVVGVRHTACKGYMPYCDGSVITCLLKVRNCLQEHSQNIRVIVRAGGEVHHDSNAAPLSTS